MYALTVWQPWASLIAEGHKPFEFRGWAAPERVVGERIAIHAGSRSVRKEELAWLIACLEGRLGKGRPALKDGALGFLRTTGRMTYPLRAIVCTAIIGESVRGDEAARRLGVAVNDSDREGTFNWGWPMLEIEGVPDIPCKGAQGLWKVPAEVVADIARSKSND